MVERYLKRQPQGRETYDLLARILTSLKRENEVIPRLEKYAAIDPKNVPLQYALAERYKVAGMASKAQKIFDDLLAEQRDTQGFADNFPKLVKERKTEELLQLLIKATGRLKRLDAVKAQVDLLVADSAYTDEVLDAGLKLISSSPPAIDPQDGWIVLVNIATEGKRPEKLAGLLRWSIKRSPNPIVYRELIFTLYDLGKYGDAESAIKELTEKFPDERNARNLILLAQIQAKAGKQDEAIGTVRDALKQEPNDPDVVRTLAILLSQAGKNDEAIETVRNVLKLDATNPDLNGLLGNMLMQAGKNDEAIALFRSLLDKFPNNEEVVKTARSSLSTIYTNMGDFAKGEAELEALFAKNPDDAGVNNDLGYLYADQGKNLEKAEAMIRKAVTEEPDNFAYLDSLGWVLFKRGKFEEARIPLEKAQSDPRVDSTIPDHLGDVYFQLQLPAKAKEAWERAMKLANQAKPVDKRLPEIRKKLESLKQFDPSPKPKTGDNP
jgi:tetratricopeptide (TPR) repeat protein